MVNLSHFTLISARRVSVRKCGVGGGYRVRPKKPDYAANNLKFSGMRILLLINQIYRILYKIQLFPIYRPQLPSMACSDAENRPVFNTFPMVAVATSAFCAGRYPKIQGFYPPRN